jgi:hypothetical protein
MFSEWSKEVTFIARQAGLTPSIASEFLRAVVAYMVSVGRLNESDEQGYREWAATWRSSSELS